MHTIIAWFAQNKVSANMLMIVLLVGGYLTAERTQKEAIPSVELDQITVSVAYPGASPRQVEKAVCIPMESAIQSLSGIDTLASFSNKASCTIAVTVAQGVNSQSLVEKIKSNLDAITNTLPETTTRPIVKQLSLKGEAARIVVSGEADHKVLKIIAENIKQDLVNRGLSSVEVDNAKSDQISIEITQANLQRYNLTFNEVARVIQRNSISSSSGQVSTQSGNYLVSTAGQANDVKDFRDIIIRAQPDGAQITLGDIAIVRDGTEESNERSYLNGVPAVSVIAFQDDRKTVTEISDTVTGYLENPDRRFPEGITLSLTADAAKYFKNRIKLLVDNAWTGLFFLFVLLTLFLSLRLSFWVSVGIPIAFSGAFIVLYLSGNSINMISTFSFLIVLGIVVDDAIIVGENIFTHQENEPDQTKAAIKATVEIAQPVLFAILTSIITFLPLLFFPGSSGKLMQSIPVVVIATLIFSLVECLLILPAHLISLSKKPKKTKQTFLQRQQQKFSSVTETLIDKYYRPSLEIILNWRHASIVAFFSAFSISLALIAGGWINVTLLSPIEGYIVSANVSFNNGTVTSDIDETIQKIESAAFEIKQEKKTSSGNDEIDFVHTIVNSSNNAAIYLVLSESDTRTLSAEQIATEWRKRVGAIPNVSKLEFNHSIGGDTGPAINLVLTSNNNDDLEKAIEELKYTLVHYPGVFQVKDSQGTGVNEIQLKLKPSAYDLGLDLNNLSIQVRQALSGINVQSIRRSSGEANIVLRYPQEERGSLWHLENLKLRLNDGSLVPLLAVADIFYGAGPARIEHLDGKRVVHVIAKIDPSISTATQIMNTLRTDFLDNLPSEYPGTAWRSAGSQLAQEQLSSQMLFYYTVAILVMYMLMAVLFKSYSQPILIMTAIPFGLVGALIGHMLLGYELTIWSMAGMIAVSGVVVNDNFVLMFYVNNKLSKGIAIHEAVRETGVSRFRPIMLTSITTFAGLTPMMLEPSWEAQFLIPMAISISFGVLFATLVSLYLVPALYLTLEDIKNLLRRFRKNDSELSPEAFSGFPIDI